MNQLNLFGDDMIKVTKKEEDVKEKANAKKASTSAKGGKETAKPASPAKKEKKEIKVFADWTLHYYGNTFSIGDFVQEIPEDGITTEQLREAMAQEFFEMTKDRTHFDHDAENKRLFPKVTGGAKG